MPKRDRAPSTRRAPRAGLLGGWLVLLGIAWLAAGGRVARAEDTVSADSLAMADSAAAADCS